MRRWLWVLVGVALVSGCGPDKPEAPPTEVIRPRIGMVMIETAHRFENAGLAAEARRWELAAYQAEELGELFNDDMTRALLPGDCDDDVADQMYFALLDDHIPALKAAAEAEDRESFASHFAAASASCNGCHATCGVSFVQVPGTPGDAIPRMDPEGAAAETPTVAPADAG